MKQLQTNIELRENIVNLENKILQEPQLKIPVKHTFGKDIYMREVFIPKGVIATGAIHKYESMHIIVSGEMLVTTEEGQRHIKGPCTMHSVPGIKRAGFAIEDTIWITVHAIKDVDQMKEEDMATYLCTKTYEEYLLEMSPYGVIES